MHPPNRRSGSIAAPIGRFSHGNRGRCPRVPFAEVLLLGRGPRASRERLGGRFRVLSKFSTSSNAWGSQGAAGLIIIRNQTWACQVSGPISRGILHRLIMMRNQTLTSRVCEGGGPDPAAWLSPSPGLGWGGADLPAHVRKKCGPAARSPNALADFFLTPSTIESIVDGVRKKSGQWRPPPKS